MCPNEFNLKLVTIALLATTYFSLKDVWRTGRYLEFHSEFIQSQLKNSSLSIQLHLLALKGECLL